MSSIQNAAIMARVHATASRRAFVTSPSYVDDRSLTTLEQASYSSNTAMSCIRKALRDRFGMDAKCARISAPINVNSGDGGGISSLNDGGIEPRSTPRTPTGRAPQRNLMERRKGYSRNRRNRQKIVNGRYIAFTFAAAVRSRDEQPSDAPRAGAVGPGHPSPRVTGATPSPHGKTGVSSPGPLHQFLHSDRRLQSPLCHAEKGSAQIWMLDGGADIPLCRLKHDAPSDRGPVAKLNLDQLARHLLLSKSGKPCRPVPVLL